MRVPLALHLLQLRLILMLLIRAALLRLQNLHPPLILMLRLLAIRKLSRKNLHLLRKVAAEVRRVDDDVVDFALCTEFHDGPVNVLATRALGFPPVAHVLAAAG